MRLRVVTLNMEQDHKRWALRRELIADALCALRPDLFAMNEVCIPLDTARWLQSALEERTGARYVLVQQTKTNGLAQVEGEALLSRLPVIETGNLDYQARDMVALVARILVGERPVDVYVTHLYRSVGDDSLRLYQVQQLLAWMDRRPAAAARIVCGDFNATLDKPSAALMATRFKPSQTEPTGFTPLADTNGEVSHPDWPRMDRCIDFIWSAGAVEVLKSGVCFNEGSPTDPSLWPSDHAGVWADLEIA